LELQHRDRLVSLYFSFAIAARIVPFFKFCAFEKCFRKRRCTASGE